MNKQEIRNVARLISQLQEDFRWDCTDDRISIKLMQAYRTVLSDLVRNLNNIRPENMEGLDVRLEL